MTHNTFRNQGKDPDFHITSYASSLNSPSKSRHTITYSQYRSTIQSSVANYIGVKIICTSQNRLQVDETTPITHYWENTLQQDERQHCPADWYFGCQWLWCQHSCCYSGIFIAASVDRRILDLLSSILILINKPNGGGGSHRLATDKILDGTANCSSLWCWTLIPPCAWYDSGNTWLYMTSPTNFIRVLWYCQNISQHIYIYTTDKK